VPTDREQVERRFRGRRVTVVGLGRFGGGVGAARWLAKVGANVSVSDKAPAESLAESARALQGCGVELHLGGHRREDFIGADWLVLSPAVPLEAPLVREAVAAGAQWTTEINLLLEQCPAEIVGITGSVGKSTTTAMAGAVLATRFRTHVGGNIGGSLLETLDDIAAGDKVVLELSSFQLERAAPLRISPHVAVVTNLSPNHLDRHGTMDAYAAAKKNIFRFQGTGDVLVLNRACEATAGWTDETPGKVDWFDPAAEPFELSVPGAHNQANAQAAWAAARALGVQRGEAAEALKEFAGLPHRLEFVAEQGGVRFCNDSKCTTPEGAIVALEAFAPRTAVILVGGYDKHVSFDALGRALAGRAKAVVALGATREKILAAVRPQVAGNLPRIVSAGDFASAVAAARRLAEPGDVVLLSPACASFDMFDNYEQRGQAFGELVRRDG